MALQPFFTIGHSNRELCDFLALLDETDVEQVVDVRKLPGSNRYPQFNADVLSEALAENEITLLRFEGLTGRRPVDKNVPFEVNPWWQNRGFHNYADHALSKEFSDALAAIKHVGRQRRTAVMCSEAVWWRCHRRIIADYLLAAGEEVRHIFAPHNVKLAQLSEGAVIQLDGRITYPARA